MLKRQREEKLPGPLQLWGKIFGEVNDYIVVFYLVATTSFPQRQYFYCTTTNPTLKAMPPLSPEFLDKAKATEGRFSGEPDRPLGEEAAADEEEEAPEEDEEGGEKPKKEVFAEHHRLAYVVSRIDHDVAVVPRGAFVLDALHRVLPARSFDGLSYEAAGMKRNYFHFRMPESPKAIATMAKEGLVRSTDFLDPIAADKPDEIWSLVYDESKTMALLQSHYWPGYTFYHEMDSGNYGGAYIGYGIENKDVAFMV
eukprot:scaffold1557_cov246-Pinguiococcus_pyrenoidosus.AAC.15